MKDIVDDEQKLNVEKVLDVMATYKRYEDVITIGAYKEGTNPKLDFAIQMMGKIRPFLKQDVSEKVTFDEGMKQLRNIFQEAL
jgi:flagellum-specific ATP synthase